MHVRGLIPLVTALAVWAPVAHAGESATVRVISCAPSQHDDEGGSVAYEARMKAVRGTARMALRITLLEKVGDADYERIEADETGVWRRSRPGAAEFVWEHRVRGLRQGSTYRALVQYRWYDADGARIASESRESAPCRQGPGLPNLRVASIDVQPGEVEETATYRVKIANRGASAARHVGVLLRVDGEVVDEVEKIEVLQPGETRTVNFSGPVCRRRLRVVVDPKQLIAESREQDNARAPTCL